MTKPYARATAVLAGPPVGGREELVGRREETRRIGEVLAAARGGRGGVVVVTGEPGMGKTRLAAEAVRSATGAGMTAVRGRPGSVGAAAAVPYRPLVEALYGLARAERLPDEAKLGPYAKVLARLLDDGEGGGTGSTGVFAVPPLVAAEAVLRLIGAVAGRRRGFLLVLEDLHEADPGTLAVVDYLVDHLAPLPAVLLLTTGPDEALVAQARRCENATVLDLGPLGPADVRRMAAGAVSGAVARRIWEESAGIPFVVRESIRERARGSDRVPASVADGVTRRAERLGPAAAELLGTGALFGARFPVPVLREATGCRADELAALLRAASAAALIVPDPADPDWYAFRHPLAARALREALGPSERAASARRAAAAVAALHPGLPDEWCARAAALHALAGDWKEAVRHYVEAAGRATSAGRPDHALGLLASAHSVAPAQSHAEVVDRLLDVVIRTGRLDALPACVSGEGAPLTPGARPARAPGRTALDGPRRPGLHARLAQVHVLAGRPGEAARELDLARWAAAAGSARDDEDTAVVELAAAYVEPGRVAPERLTTAAESARRAARAASRAGLPEAAGRALLALGRLVQDRDEEAAAAYFARARQLAAPAAPAREPSRGPACESACEPARPSGPGSVPLRIAADACLARLAMRRDGLTAAVEQVRREALAAGLRPLAHETGFALALDRVRRGAFTAAGELVQEGVTDAERHGLGRAVALWRLADAVREAHQGHRAGLREALERFAPLADAAPGLRAMEYGLARAFCSLLEEDHEAAEREFAQALAYDAENPASGDFGRHGVALLLGVLTGRLGRRHHDRVAGVSAAAARWNRPFVGLAHAVLLGREGRPGEASAAADAALEAAAPYPVARHLGLRLAAGMAYEDGWGAPVDWLREAEEYFHGAGVAPVAGACRALLRGMGAPVRQRRSGTELVPAGLRRCGITVREFEVARLLAERFGNRDIAGRLHISPRTVEKHVASVLQKTGLPDRAAFASAARDLGGVLSVGPDQRAASGARDLARPAGAEVVSGK
ncbi:AAA family ATPase [Streptomyces sp. NPDC053493]|uniref:AAA family ATPase n=1 Tax=Streptomyces sp. NPDC053493 TaxID=3365705 RepID=UPI0037D68278